MAESDESQPGAATMVVHSRWPYNMLRARRTPDRDGEEVALVPMEGVPHHQKERYQWRVLVRESTPDFWKLAPGSKSNFQAPDGNGGHSSSLLLEDYDEATEGWVVRVYQGHETLEPWQPAKQRDVAETGMLSAMLQGEQGRYHGTPLSPQAHACRALAQCTNGANTSAQATERLPGQGEVGVAGREYTIGVAGCLDLSSASLGPVEALELGSMIGTPAWAAVKSLRCAHNSGMVGKLDDYGNLSTPDTCSEAFKQLTEGLKTSQVTEADFSSCGIGPVALGHVKDWVREAATSVASLKLAGADLVYNKLFGSWNCIIDRVQWNYSVHISIDGGNSTTLDYRYGVPDSAT